MTIDDIAQRCQCCGCGGQIGPRVNLVELDYRAEWEYPRSGNVLTGDDGRAVAICCDACAEAGRVTRAVEFRGDEVVYHDLASLTRLPPPSSYVLVSSGRATGIKCLLCGRTSFSQDDVTNRYCGACHRFHAVGPERTASSEQRSTS